MLWRLPTCPIQAWKTAKCLRHAEGFRLLIEPYPEIHYISHLEPHWEQNKNSASDNYGLFIVQDQKEAVATENVNL